MARIQILEHDLKEATAANTYLQDQFAEAARRDTVGLTDALEECQRVVMQREHEIRDLKAQLGAEPERPTVLPLGGGDDE